MEESLQNVLLIGCTGNIGSVVYNSLLAANFRVTCTIRKNGNSDVATLVPYENIQNVVNFTPNTIINLSNYYTQDTRPAASNRMENSILGVATAISNSNLMWQAKVINASSYFQYCPEEKKPWSNYSKLKSEALKILEANSIMSGTSLTNFILYDNYGGLNKSKFFDLLIKSISLEEEFNTTFGMQFINLTHIKNVASAIVSECFVGDLNGNNAIRTYDLRGKYTFRLRTLAEIVSSELKIKPKINWGVVSYRPKEVFNLWKTEYDHPEYWNPVDEIEMYIHEQFDYYTKEKKLNE